MKRRFLPLLSAALLAGVLLAAPAAAQSSTTADSPAPGQPETYAAAAQGSALTLDLLGQNITVGGGTVGLDSTPKASAAGNGVLLLSTPVGATSATATENGQDVTDGTPSSPVCGPLSLPSSLPVLGLTTACSFAHAAVKDNLPEASAGGQSVNLSVGVSSLPASVTSGLSDLVTNLTGTLSSVLDPIVGGILDPITGGSISLNQLGTLLNELVKDPSAELVTVKLGDSTSSVAATADAVTASSTATGGTVCVGAIASLCLVTITIGQATATAVRDRGASSATPTVNPSLITVQILPVLFQGLSKIPALGDVLKGLLPNKNGIPTLTLQQGQEFAIPQLGLDLRASAGATKTTEDGASASASSLKLTLLDLPGLSGGISLALADANASVAGTAAGPPVTTTTPPPTSPPTTAPKKLAYTGTNEPWRPFAAGALLLLAIGGFEVVRRARRRRVEY